MYRYGPPLSIDTKISTIELHMTSLWRQSQRALGNFLCIKNIYVKISKINFSLKNRRNMGFSQDFWLNMLGNDDSHLHSKFEAHILSNILEMGKIKIMGFHQPPSLPDYHSLWRPPYPNGTPYFSPYTSKDAMHKGCRNDYLEAFGAVYWAKNAILKKFLGGLQQPPFGGRGLMTRVILNIKNWRWNKHWTLSVCFRHF